MAKKAEEVKMAIEGAISADTDIQDTTHIGINVVTSGALLWKKESLKIVGRVNKEKELEAVKKIAEKEAKGLKVDISLRVENRS